MMHIAFALALAFFVLYFAQRTEGLIRKIGTFTGWFIIALALLSMLTALVFAAQNPTFPPHSKYDNKMNKKMEVMNEKDNEDDDKPERTGSACPIN
jgi:hypothetical protein